MCLLWIRKGTSAFLKLLSSTVWLTVRNLLSKATTFILFPHFVFLIPNCNIRLLWKLLRDSVTGSQSKSTLACVERQWGIPRALISDGAPLFVSLERNVSEEILYNVIAREGHSCPGSLLHTPVSSHTATNDVICHPIQKTLPTKPTHWLERFFFLSYWGIFLINFLNKIESTTWVHVEKIPNSRKKHFDICQGHYFSVCVEISGITYMQTSWLLKYNPISLAWKC